MTRKNECTFYRWDSMKKERVSDMLERRLITGDRMMLAHVYLRKGCVVPRHAHENEQLTYILEGALKFLIGATGGRGAVHPLQRASRGARVGGHARRGRIQPAAARLARQDGQLPAARVTGSGRPGPVDQDLSRVAVLAHPFERLS